MGKLLLVGIALVALSPALVAGVSGPILQPSVQRELNREEKVFQEEFRELEEKYNCPNFVNGEYAEEFSVRLDRINNARRRAYQTRQQVAPPDFFCEFGGSGA